VNVDELTEQLRRAAADVELRPGSARFARTLGQRRRIRRRWVTAGVAAVAAVGATALGLRFLTRDATSVTTTDSVPPPTGSAPAVPTPSGPPATGAPTVTGPDAIGVQSGPAAFVWRTVEPDSVAAVGTPFFTDAYTYVPPALPGVMVSTSPGVNNPDKMLWRSDDGVTWTQVGALPTDSTAAASATAGDRVYVVGTQPGVADPVQRAVRVSISDDLGTTWRGVNLPLQNADLAARAAGHPIVTSVGGVAAVSDLAVVTVRQRVDVNPTELLTDLGYDPMTTTITPTGLQRVECGDSPAGTVLPEATAPVPSGPGGCTPGAVGEIVPWADLGPIGDTLQAAITAESRTFVSTDGATFTELPMPADGLVDVVVYPLDDGIVLAGKQQDGQVTSRLWHTTDGATWSELPAPPTGGFVGRLGDGLVSISNYAPGRYAIDLDGTGWRQGDLAPLLAPRVIGYTSRQIATGPAGITLVVSVADPASPTSDPASPTSTGPPTPTGDPATATTIAGAATEGPTGYEVLHTVDGVTWTHESLADLLGMSNGDISGVPRVQQAGNSVVVAVNLRTIDPDTSPRQLVLVGTPAG
jgi:hypothetical protein